MNNTPDPDAVYQYLIDLQDRITSTLGELDGVAGFREETWERDAGGGGRSRVIEDGGRPVAPVGGKEQFV